MVKGGTFDVFQHKVLLAVELLRTVDGGDAGVVQRGKHLRFALESSQSVGIVGQVIGQHFDGHIAFQTRIVREIRPHPCPRGRSQLGFRRAQLVEADFDSRYQSNSSAPLSRLEGYEYAALDRFLTLRIAEQP